jgi:hypothetical protein
MGEVLGSRIVLRSGDEVFTAWPPPRVRYALVGAEDPFMDIPLLPMDDEADDEPYRFAAVRRDAVILIEPLDEREVEAHRRDREEWIEHG